MINLNIKSNKGFSMIELMVSIAILAFILTAFGLFQSDVFSFNRILQTGLLNQSEAKKLIRPFVNEVRSAKQSDLGAYPLETVEESTFTFFSDIDSDGYVERIRYFYDDGDFKKGIIEPDPITREYNEADEEIIKVIYDISNNEIFHYYGSNYDGSDDSTPLVDPITPSDVRLIRVEVEIDSSPGTPPEPFVVKTQVSLRNLKDNL